MAMLSCKLSWTRRFDLKVNKETSSHNDKEGRGEFKTEITVNQSAVIFVFIAISC